MFSFRALDIYVLAGLTFEVVIFSSRTPMSRLVSSLCLSAALALFSRWMNQADCPRPPATAGEKSYHFPQGRWWPSHGTRNAISIEYNSSSPSRPRATVRALRVVPLNEVCCKLRRGPPMPKPQQRAYVPDGEKLLLWRPNKVGIRPEYSVAPLRRWSWDRPAHSLASRRVLIT